jgi:DHA2 family multidrug resistance protein
LPIGAIAFAGLLVIMGEMRGDKPVRLDLLGFVLLGLSVAGLQLVLDRGQLLDWFNSREIWIEATVAALTFYLFVVHSFTAESPFLNPMLFRDGNYVIGNVMGLFLGGLMYGVMALTAPMLAELMGYPIELVGWTTAPRGVGTMLTMLLLGPIVNRFDPRVLILAGVAICGVSMIMLSRSSLEMDSSLVVASGFVQGLGGGIMFVPITTVVFATLAPQFRNEGAAINSLIRNLGGTMSISILQTLTIRNEAMVHSRLAEGVRPDNPALGMTDFDFGSLQAVARMDGEVGRQALMVSYVDTYWLLFLACLAVMPLVLLLRQRR